MDEIGKIIDEKNRAIEALKILNKNKKKAISRLIKDCIEKDHKIIQLERKLGECWEDYNRDI